MLRPRIIPLLLVQNGGLVKTVNFDKPKYVGDPINAVRIFNEKEVDELTIVDIDATVQRREPNYSMIAKLAAESQMPICYGGGISTTEQVSRLVSLGVEKVALSAAAVSEPQLISDAATKVGSQSVVVVMDVRTANGSSRLFTHNGRRASTIDPVEFAAKAQSLGAGEIVVNSIDRDGTMKGYDVDLIARVRAATSLPLTAAGGAGSLQDIAMLFRRFGNIGAAAGSLFVFKGSLRAVLINYPTRDAKDDLILASRQTAP